MSRFRPTKKLATPLVILVLVATGGVVWVHRSSEGPTTSPWDAYRMGTMRALASIEMSPAVRTFPVVVGSASYVCPSVRTAIHDYKGALRAPATHPFFEGSTPSGRRAFYEFLYYKLVFHLCTPRSERLQEHLVNACLHRPTVTPRREAYCTANSLQHVLRRLEVSFRARITSPTRT